MEYIMSRKPFKPNEKLIIPMNSICITIGLDEDRGDTCVSWLTPC